MALYGAMFSQYGIKTGQVLVNKVDFYNEYTRENLQATLNELLELNIIPILNTNDAIASKPGKDWQGCSRRRATRRLMRWAWSASKALSGRRPAYAKCRNHESRLASSDAATSAWLGAQSADRAMFEGGPLEWQANCRRHCRAASRGRLMDSASISPSHRSQKEDRACLTALWNARLASERAAWLCLLGARRLSRQAALRRTIAL